MVTNIIRKCAQSPDLHTPTCSAYTHVFDPYIWLEEWPARFEKEGQ